MATLTKVVCVSMLPKLNDERLNGLPGVLARLLRILTQQGLITHVLAEPDFSGDGLEAKFMGLCRLDEKSRFRRIGAPSSYLPPR